MFVSCVAVACSLLRVVGCLLFVNSCWLFLVVWRWVLSLVVVRCWLFVERSSLFVVCCMLMDVCCCWVVDACW